MTPISAGERYRAIDIIRGLALFGVLMVNLMSDFRIPLLEHILHPPADPVDMVVSAVLEFKALTIFSFLFGVGIAIQFERATARERSAVTFFLRRFGWLLIIGLVHMFLIWNGDILTLYAVCGFLLLPAVRLRWQLLVAIGILWIALPEIRWFPLHLPAAHTIAETRRIYSSGCFLAILRYRWYESWHFIIPILVAVVPRTTGLIYLGVATWRSGILRNVPQHRHKLLAALVVSGIGGAILTIRPVNHADTSIVIAVAYFCGLLLFLTPGRAAWFPGLAALGQMALTNYLMESIILGFIFYGYGFGLFGRLGPYAAAGIGIAVYILQIQFSRWWLARYRFGPFEWLWRSLTYGKRQPMIPYH
jgi:uncharacterized protein